MRNPMQTIVAVTESLMEESNVNTKHKETISSIADAANLMRRLADDVLDLSRIEAGQLHIENLSYDLPQCIRRAVHGLEVQAQKKGLQFHQNIDATVPKRVICDPTRVQQIMTNLLS